MVEGAGAGFARAFEQKLFTKIGAERDAFTLPTRTAKPFQAAASTLPHDALRLA